MFHLTAIAALLTATTATYTESIPSGFSPLVSTLLAVAAVLTSLGSCIAGIASVMGYFKSKDNHTLALDTHAMVDGQRSSMVALVDNLKATVSQQKEDAAVIAAGTLKDAQAFVPAPPPKG